MLKRLVLVSLTLGAAAFLLFSKKSSAATTRTPTGRLLDSGIASWYGGNYNGRPTASGEIFDDRLMTAAHKKLKLGTIVDVTNLENGLTVRVKVNDRGPYVGNRIIDLSRGAAEALGFVNQGLTSVEVRQV